MENTYRYMVHDFRQNLKRAHVDLGEVHYDDAGYFWMENVPDWEGVETRGFLTSKSRLPKAAIPEDLVFFEFRDLNPDDLNELLAFQKKYGLLTSIFRSQYVSLFQIGQQSKIMNPYEYFEYDLLTVKKTNGFFTVYDPEKERHVPTEEDYKHSKFDTCSVEEASYCVKRLHWAIDLLLDMRPESGNLSHRVEMTEILTATLAQVVSEYLPLVEYTDDPASPIPMPLSVLLVGQLLSALSDTESFHLCKYECCNRVFQWKRNSNGIAGRRSGAQYCCDDHQIRQKRINQRKRRQEDKK